MLLATTQVEDFDRFMEVFSTAGAEKRKQHGSKGALDLPRSLRGRSGLGDLRLGRAGLAELRVRPRGPADHEGGRAQVAAAGRAVRRPLRRLRSTELHPLSSTRKARSGGPFRVWGRMQRRRSRTLQVPRQSPRRKRAGRCRRDVEREGRGHHRRRQRHRRRRRATACRRRLPRRGPLLLGQGRGARRRARRHRRHRLEPVERRPPPPGRRRDGRAGAASTRSSTAPATARARPCSSSPTSSGTPAWRSTSSTPSARRAS